MPKFTTVTALAVRWDGANIDTDQIIPARFLKFPRRDGYAKFLFHDLRFDAAGAPCAGFFLNQHPEGGIGILVAGENFGCGSSREGAVYALYDAGITCVIAPSFGDIFYNNAIKNFLLPIRLPPAPLATIREAVGEAGAVVTVDLQRQVIVLSAGANIPFAIDPSRKAALLAGLDEIRQTLQHAREIEAFAHRRLTAEPWLRRGGD